MTHTPDAHDADDEDLPSYGLNPRRRTFLTHWTTRLGFATAVVALLGALIQLNVDWRPVGIDKPPGAPPSAVITSPALTALPQQEVTVAGAHQNLPPDTVLWLVIQDMTTNDLHPQNRPCSVEPTTFNCGDSYVGPDVKPQRSLSFTLKIVMVTPSAVNEFMQYDAKKRAGLYPGLSSLPKGATLLTSKEVTR